MRTVGRVFYQLKCCRRRHHHHSRSPPVVMHESTRTDEYTITIA